MLNRETVLVHTHPETELSLSTVNRDGSVKDLIFHEAAMPY